MRLKSAGFSLVELMIALLLGLLLLGGAISVFLSNQATGRTNNVLSELQNVARLSSQLMSQDIRNAGFTGCNNVRVSNVIAAGGVRPDWSNWNAGSGLEGLTAPVGDINGMTPNAGSEAIRVMFAGSQTNYINAYDGSNLTLNQAPVVATNDIAMACDENLASIFQVNATGLTTATHTAAGLNCDPDLGFVFEDDWVCGVAPTRQFSNNALLMRFESVTWFTAPSLDDATVSSLFRTSLVGGTLVNEEILYGVESLTFNYLDGSTMTYQTAATVAANNGWENVIAVRVTVTIDDAILGTSEVPVSAKNITFLVNLRNRIGVI